MEIETASAGDTSKLSRIGLALDALLRAAINDALTHREDRPIRFFTIAEIKAETLPTRADSEIASLIENPIGTACRSAIRKLGQEVFRLTGPVAAMGQTAERVAEMDPPNWGRRTTILDRVWDGIGEGNNRWWS